MKRYPMNKFLSSCLLFLLIFSTQLSKAQFMNFSVTPQVSCFGAPGTNTALAFVTASCAVPAGLTYSYNIVSPPCGNATFTVIPTSLPTGSAIAISYPCCGEYTISLFGYAPGPVIACPQVSYISTVVCPNGVSVTSSAANNTAVCANTSLSLTGIGAATYTWLPPLSAGGGTIANVNPFILSPTANGVFTINASSPAPGNCPLSTTFSMAVSMATLGVSPASQTMCNGSPIPLNSTVAAINGGSVSAGTIINSVNWYAPCSPLTATAGPNATVQACPGDYTATAIYTGIAGTCAISNTVAVVSSTSIPVTLTASSASICPGGTVQLVAQSAQTSTNSNHTWFQSAGGPIFSFGNPITRTVATLPRTFTVNVNYFGCPGTATTVVGLLALTPTLTPSAFSVCPNRSLTLSASGGINYTFTAIPPFPAPSFTLQEPTPSTATHVPTQAQLANMLYAVTAESVGCTGSSTISVNLLTINPTLTLSSPSQSVCPNTSFTITASGGAGSNYTFTAPPNTSTVTGAVNTMSYAIAPAAFPSIYTVSVDSAGCQGVNSVTVGLLTLTPTYTLSSPTSSICPGTSVTITSSGGPSATYQYSTDLYAPTNISNTLIGITNPITHVAQFNPTTNIASYTVAVDSAGCVGSTTFTLGILNLAPNVNFNALPPIACPNSIITLTTSGYANAANYTFTYSTASATTNNSTGTTTMSAPSTSLTFPGTFTLNVDSAGCVGTKVIGLGLKVLSATIAATPTNVCAGQNVTVTCSNYGGFPTVYNFAGLSGGPPPTQTVLSGPLSQSIHVFQPTVNTTYVVHIDSAGCTNELSIPIASINVVMNPSLVITASSSPSIICSGLPSTLSVAGSTAYTYTWTAPSGPISNTTLVPVNPTVTTIYTVNALDAGGCVGNSTIALTVDPTASLSMNISAPLNTICPLQSNTLTASGAVNYTWTPPLYLTSTLTAVTVANVTVTNPPASVVYTVRGNNGLGCNGSRSFTLSINAFPTVQIVPTASNVCVGFTSTLTAFGAQSYTWTGSTFTGNIAQQSISVGPGIYTVTASNGGSCIENPPKTFSVGLAPDLTISYSQTSGTTCIINNSPKLSKPIVLTAFGAATYAWLPYDPATMTFSLGPQTTVRPHASTCYTVIGGTSVCSGDTVICVNVIPQFTINVVPPLPAICLGDSLKLSVTGIGPGAVGSPAAYTFSWTEAQNAPPISLSDILTPTVMAFPLNTTTYSVDVADTRSCVSLPRLVTVTVLARPITTISLPVINNAPTNTVCFVGDSPGAPDNVITLTASNQNGNLPFGILPTYTWSSPYSSILTPPNNAGVTVNAPFRLPATVVYTVVSGYNGVNGCRREDTVTIRVVDCRPITLVSFTTAVERDTICSRECITFINLTDTLAGGPQEVFWQFEEGSPSTSTLSSPTICYNLPGEHNVILTVKNPYPKANGGSSGQKGLLRYIKVVDIPNVTIEPPGQSRSDRYIRFGESTTLSGSNALSYLWSPAYNISSLTSPEVSVNPINSTQYVLWGYNSKNCFSSDTINVIVVQDCGEMYVPNAFSPNGDSHNDYLKVQGICLETMTFMVFNRWGEKVFESTDQKIGWDGKYKGEDMGTGVYFYRLEGKTYDGKGFTAKGNVTLIR